MSSLYEMFTAVREELQALAGDYHSLDDAWYARQAAMLDATLHGFNFREYDGVEGAEPTVDISDALEQCAQALEICQEQFRLFRSFDASVLLDFLDTVLYVIDVQAPREKLAEETEFAMDFFGEMRLGDCYE